MPFNCLLDLNSIDSALESCEEVQFHRAPGDSAIQIDYCLDRKADSQHRLTLVALDLLPAPRAKFLENGLNRTNQVCSRERLVGFLGLAKNYCEFEVSNWEKILLRPVH